MLGCRPHALSLLACLAGCAAATPHPMPVSVSASLADDEMRRLETQSLYVYYPAHQGREARRTARRLETCVGELRERALIRGGNADDKLVIVMPDQPLNNAFVYPPLISSGPFSVIPTHATANTVAELGLPLDPSVVGCHEVVHYVQLNQIGGLWRWVNTIFGNVITPQAGLELWFLEGLATYYETILQPGIGRMAWPVWRGFFHAAFAGGDLDGGDLSALHRPFHFGNHYLAGSYFVKYLAERYGEDKLWQLIAVQGRSIFFPLMTSLRFRSVYGKTLTGLFEEFEAHVAESFLPRRRPAGQVRIRAAGEDAKYAVGADGSEALVIQDGDTPPRLLVYGHDGRQRASRNLIDVVPGRDIARTSATFVTGLTLTADGSQVYFVALDPGHVQLEARLFRFDVASGELDELASDLRGPGGGIAPDGERYYFARASGDRHDLAVYELAEGRHRVVRRAEPRHYYSAIRPSPSGRWLVASLFRGDGFELQVVDARSGQLRERLVHATGPISDPWFIDDDRIVFVAEAEGRFQVFEHDLRTGARRRLSDAPYLALAPRPHLGRLRFLNRHHQAWSLDEVELPLEPAEEGGQEFAAPGATPAGGAVSAPSEAELAIVGDEPYSSFDNLFVPNLRALALLSPTVDAALFGLVLTGQDRLMKHRWGLAGLYQPLTNYLSGVAFYQNRQLAPLTITVGASHVEFGNFPTGLEDAIDNDLDPASERRQRRAELLAARPFRTMAAGIGARYVQDRFREPGLADSEQELGGPFAGFSYQATEATPFAGVRRELSLAVEAAAYPEAANSLDESFYDVRGRLGVTTPLPLSTRHTLSLSGRARALAGLSQPLLQVGGATTLGELYRRSDQPEGPDFDDDLLPLDVELFEPLRGYEDYALSLRRVAIGTATYRYPLIIDYGFTSTFWLLPSFLLRQVNVELFGAGALDWLNTEDPHLAAGGSIDVAFSIGLAPLSVRYQLARRFSDDDALVHLITIGAGGIARDTGR